LLFSPKSALFFPKPSATLCPAGGGCSQVLFPSCSPSATLHVLTPDSILGQKTQAPDGYHFYPVKHPPPRAFCVTEEKIISTLNKALNSILNAYT